MEVGDENDPSYVLPEMRPAAGAEIPRNWDSALRTRPVSDTGQGPAGTNSGVRPATHHGSADRGMSQVLFPTSRESAGGRFADILVQKSYFSIFAMPFPRCVPPE